MAAKLGVEPEPIHGLSPPHDGLVEERIQWIEQYLRFLLTTAQQNELGRMASPSLRRSTTTATNSTLGMTPKEALFGYRPISTSTKSTTPNEAVESRSRPLNQKRAQAKAAITRREDPHVIKELFELERSSVA